MPRRQQTIRVCDLCGSEASQHTIIHNGRGVQVDLCPGHASPLEELFERFALATSRAPGYSTSPHQCTICKTVLSRRYHAAYHVQTQHGYGEDESYAHIQPVGDRIPQVLTGPSHRPHRCTVCKKPYVNASTARRHVEQKHPDRIRRGRGAGDLVRLIEESD